MLNIGEQAFTNKEKLELDKAGFKYKLLNIKSYDRVIASQSSDIKTLLLSLNTLKASVEDSVSAIKNISSTLASLTNSSNAAATRKTSYSPRFDPFSSTMDLDSPPRPPRKEPYLGPAVDNTATSNLDPLIDTGSKEGFKDTITSSIVKELSKKAYTIPDDSKLSGESNFEQWIQALSIVLRALGISNFLENPDISNTYSDSDQAVLLMLLHDSLSSGPRAAISWIYIPSKAFKLLVRQYSRPIESKKEDVYNEFHALTFSTYKKGLSAFNAEFNGYLAKLTMAKIDIDPSLILNQYFKALESKFPSWVSRQKSSIRQARMLGLTASSLNIEYLMADILEESRNPATEAYRAAHIANSSNSTPNSNSNPSKKGKNKKKGKKKASYNVEGQNYSAKSAEQASFMLGSYNLAIEEEEAESDSSSNSSSSSDSNTQLAQLLALKGYKKRKDFKGKGLKTSSNNKAKYKDNKPRRRPKDPALYNSWLYDTGSTDHISNSKERFTTFTPNTGQLRPINTGNSPVSPAGIGSITLEVLSRKAPPTYTKLVLDNVLYLPNIDINIVSGVRHYDSGGCLIKETLYGGNRRYIAILDFKKSGFFLDVKGSSKPILHANFAFPLGLSSYTTKSIELQRNKIVVEIPSNSIRKEDYRPIIEDAIVSEAIEPNKRYKLRNSPAKGTTLEGVGPSLRGKRPRRPVEPLATAQAPYQSPRKTREPEPLTGTGDLPRVLREPVIKGNKVVEKAISSPTLKEPNIGQRDYYNLLNLAKLWHVRLGHIGLRLLKKTSSITKGLPNFDKIKEADFHCSSYNRGKAVRRVSKALIPDPPRVLDSIEGDTVKIRPRPYNRNPIVLLLVDRKSRYRWVFNLPNKSGPIVANAIKGFFRGLRNGFGRYPTKFHFDGGTEITDLLTTWLAKRGIKFSTSAPYIHEQNVLVERSCFILEAVVELVNSTAITNRETTPFQALFNELEPGIPHIPNLERYRAIGARGEAIIPLEKRSKSLKFTSRTEECKLLAVLGSKTYLVYIPSRRAVLKTSTIKFIEDNTVLSQPTDNTALEGELVDLDLDLEGAVSPDPSNLNTEKPISIEIGPSKLEPYESSSDSELDKPSPDKPINPVIVESTRPTISIRKPELPEAFPQTIEPIFAPKPIEVIAPNQPITNEPLDNSNLISEGDKIQLDYYKLLAKTSSYILSFIYKARKRVISKDSTPTTYKQVLKLPRDERSKWLEAITKEFIQLLELGVFKFLPRSLLPSNRKLITCRNVLKVKKDAKNRPIKYKSRLVARGFMQVEGLDYTITYASTSIPPTWRILLAIGAVLDWEIEQADFIGAFLNSALREEIYMEIPEGLLDLAASNKAIYKLLLKYGYNPSTPNIIKLSKALYGLKQSPREWQDKLKILLKSLGYLPLISDPGVFYNAKTCHFILTYIDDCLFIGPNIGYITDLKKRLNKVYAIEDLGPAAYFLGVQIIRDRPNRRLWLNQVDISFTIQWLSRSLNRPIKSHLNAAKNLFKYLNSTKDYSICFSYNGNTVADLGPKLSNSSNTTTKLSRDFHSKEGPRPLTTTSTTIVDSRNSKGSSRTSIINSSLVPIGFSDSDFAGDKATSKSTYGYLYKLAGRPISWKTKRATTIALSTLEAETDRLTEAIREVQWIIGLFSKLYRPIDYPITLYRDNQGSITVANDPALYARTKHTLLKFRYVREQVKAKIVTIIYLNTKSRKCRYLEELLADMSGHCHDEHKDHDHHGQSHAGEHDHSDEIASAIQFSLYQHINFDEISTLNEAQFGSGKAIVKKSWDERLNDQPELESDADEQLLIGIPFTGQVKLHSILLRTSNSASAPRLLKVFVNRDDVDFGVAEAAEGTQAFELSQTSEVQELPVKRARFGQVQRLTLFFADNFGLGDEDVSRVAYLGFKGEWMQLGRAPANILYEAAANPGDHKVKGTSVNEMGGGIGPGS
ncbi:hypothetical protein P8C59_000229 [Phyllachora maydis]|uniref:Integrase catalytic domain-containing protein n=1 Tax=Phyllachora maydis TaxID=1825666 RepID=A0AAD9M8H9_9PEZI|nr:hypothetical protein P8C59_000229 [Phyllachora maydis]